MRNFTTYEIIICFWRFMFIQWPYRNHCFISIIYFSHDNHITANIGPRNGGTGGKKQGYGTGRQTLRFRANGPAKVEEVDDMRTTAEEKINGLLENFLGINDADLG